MKRLPITVSVKSGYVALRAKLTPHSVTPLGQSRVAVPVSGWTTALFLQAKDRPKKNESKFLAGKPKAFVSPDTLPLVSSRVVASDDISTHETGDVIDPPPEKFFSARRASRRAKPSGKALPNS